MLHGAQTQASSLRTCLVYANPSLIASGTDAGILAVMDTFHTWERIEIQLDAKETYANPYTDVEVWADLRGPGFSKRVYGFWDGDNTFRIRVVADKPGIWHLETAARSGARRAANPIDDRGLVGVKRSFKAVAWTDAEKDQNPTRRGFIRASENGHAFELADGTPFFLVGDTWWSTPSYRYPWYDDDERRPIGPEMGFKDMVAYRKDQGFNSIAILAALPTWANDGRPARLCMDDAEKTAVRAAWRQPGTESAKDMHNEGGRPFCFPGKVPGYEEIVPDFDRINPDYFRYMDRKIDYLNEYGFFPFIEVARRDVSQVWKRYGGSGTRGWAESYARYIHYIFARYQAHNCLLSPIHFDHFGFSIPSREYNEPANMVIDRWGPPPFGTLLGTNAAPSTLINFGQPGEARWLTFHQLGNWREHGNYWYLTQIYRSETPLPAVNGEPYYPGFPVDDPPAPSKEANLNCRSGMYGGFLSGAFAGYIYGVEGIWGGDIEPEARYRMWESLQFESGGLVRHLKTFAEGLGIHGVDELIPEPDMVTPNRSGPELGYRGWAFCARTEGNAALLCYFEKDCPRASIRGLAPETSYAITWFDPVAGVWLDDEQIVTTNESGGIELPKYPMGDDNALRLIRYEAP